VGKEKDKETGLYYFGARYMEPRVGRFVTVDPVGPVDPRTNKSNEKLLLNPQKLNRYAYSINNPYRYIDPDGKWPEEVHNTIIRAAFSGGKYKVSPSAMAALMRGSAYADTFQEPRYSYMHAMRASGQSVEEAERLMKNFINYHVKEYKTLMSQGKTKEAYEASGMAMHPIMDATSPSHEGMQEWEGVSHAPIEASKHGWSEREGEFNSNPDYSRRSVELLRKFYDENRW